MKYILASVLIFCISLTELNAQSKDTAVNRNLIESQNFIFKARSVSPLHGGMRQLTSDYDITVKKDSLISDLPYFGRAFTAPIDPDDAGMRFTSARFEYNAMKKKEHRWDIVIQPKDLVDVRELSFTVYDNGSAILRITSLNRESISYNEYIIAAGNDKK